MSVAATSRSLALRHGVLSCLKAGTGPAVVIVHGVGGHKEDWTGLMGALAPAHTAYAVDMLGFGGSSKDVPDLRVTAQGEALGALLDAEGIAIADVVGNSIGGWVAAAFAAAHPDRLRRLALVDPAGFKAMFDGPSPVNCYPDTVEEIQKLLSFVRHDPA
jgi:pimeloyl-ACP methyl ester carboxylesterase